ncbi:MAG: DUF2058 domain-containing protein [Gammaproteobacteria bacterium]|nr:DUF2058 domain-containing protein [Gammaproteobacteria bacterium]
MSSSLQDQLLKTGVANEQQAKKAHKAKVERRKHQEKARKGAPPASAEEREQLRRAQTEKAARDRTLNLQRQEAAARRARVAEIRQLVEAHRQPREGGDVPYHFVDDTVVRRIHVTKAMHERLGRDQLAVVRYGDGYEVVPVAVAEKIKTRDPAAVIPPNLSDKPLEEDDPYAGYEVPDDLMW